MSMCNRCEGAVKVCVRRAETARAYDGHFTTREDEALRCVDSIRSTCIAARHARDDAALVAEARTLTHVETDDAGVRETFEMLRRLAARLEGGK